MVEMLMAVAIIGVLSGMSIIGVSNYLRSMAQLERDTVAKEIFIAAQNHLTMAEGQGFLGVTESGFGTKDELNAEDKDGVYYFIVNKDEITADTFSTNSMLGLMLPFGSIDETIRTGGNYIVRYQIKPAHIVDVFYCAAEGDRYVTKFINGDGSGGSSGVSYNDAVEELRGDDNKSTRKNYNGADIGWYGDSKQDELTSSSSLEKPEIEIVNGDVLYVNVTTKNKDEDSKLQVKLYIQGTRSGASCYVALNDDSNSAETSYKYVLDDITTTNRHFTQINSRRGQTEKSSDNSVPFNDVIFETGSAAFIPGEDIKVYAEVFNNSTLTSIAKSTVRTTNSLFGDVIEVDTEDPTTKTTTVTTEISVSKMRHLQNLNDAHSEMFYVTDENGTAFKYNAIVDGSTGIDVVQTADLDWNDFLTEVRTVNGLNESDPVVVYSDKTADASDASAPAAYSSYTEDNCWLPVSPAGYELNYDGQRHSISNVTVNYEGDAGLFGTVHAGSISNLELIDFDITSVNNDTAQGSAGALAGSLEMRDKVNSDYHLTTVTNVIAHNSVTSGTSTSGTPTSSTANIEVIQTDGTNPSSLGSAGGLVGSVTGSSVSSEHGGIYACAASVRVSGIQDAGGLIGSVKTMTTIEGCYSGGFTQNGVYYTQTTDSGSTPAKTTRTYIYSVTGAGNVGGLIGDAGASVIKSSYSTCAVSGTAASSVAGGLAGNIDKNYTEFGNTHQHQISHCYSTGLVNVAAGGRAGAFAGNVDSGTDLSDCNYYEIINEMTTTTTTTSGDETEKTTTFDGYLKAVGSDSDTSVTSGVTAFDAETSSATALQNYQSFISQDSAGASRSWGYAVPYDSALSTYFTNAADDETTTEIDESTAVQFNLRTVTQLGYEIPADETEGYYVERHYGDWAMWCGIWDARVALRSCVSGSRNSRRSPTSSQDAAWKR